MNQILDKKQTLQKIRRMAYQIYENNIDENMLIFAGVKESGYVLARLLWQTFQEISPIKSQLVSISLDKNAPLPKEIIVDTDLADLHQKTIILTDDVLNSGKTLAYALDSFLKTQPKKIQTAVLVSRSHRRFPIAADYTGYALATTLQQHVEVILNNDDKFGVYLY